MSEAKHTPGPWSHGADENPADNGIEGPGGGFVAHVQFHANVNTIARNGGELFSHADARLIASAPDLLAACESARRLLALIHSPNASQSGFLAAMAEASLAVNAALAKAKGAGG